MGEQLSALSQELSDGLYIQQKEAADNLELAVRELEDAKLAGLAGGFSKLGLDSGMIGIAMIVREELKKMGINQMLEKVWELVTIYGLKVIAAMVIFVVGRWIARFISNMVRKMMRKADVDQTLRKFVANMTYIALLVFVVLAALSQLCIQTKSFIAVLGAAMTSDNIVNWTVKGTRRVDMVMGIGYDDDIDKAKQIMADVLARDPRILTEAAPQIAMVELADSSVNFVVRPWVKASDYWAVHMAVHEAIKKAFDAEGISIPYPQRDVHLYQHTQAD